jgi:hypothetical protein
VKPYALLVLLVTAAPLTAQEQVTARRLSDVVAVRLAAAGTERVLYYFNPTQKLVVGDQLEQGSGGLSEILLSGGGLVSSSASTHVIIDSLAADGDVLDVPLLTAMLARTGERPLQLKLPGGTTCDVVNTEVTVRIEHGRLRIRNEGGAPVVVTGDMRPERDTPGDSDPGRVQIARGEEIRIVLVRGDIEEAGQLIDLWGAVAVRHDQDVQLQQDGDQLRPRAAEGQPPEACVLTVRGVRTVPRPGLVVGNPSHVTLAAPPAPAAPAEPAPTPEASPAAPSSPPDQGQTPAPADEGRPKDGSPGGGAG